MISDQEYAAWLRNPAARRVLLADLEHAAGVEYVASQPYVSRPTDAVPNRIYRDLIADAVGITIRLDSVPEVGDLVLVDDGSISHWVGHRWRGYPVVLRLGDPAWSWDDFRVLARQVSAGLVSAQRGQIRLGLYDRTALLDKPLERDLLPDGQPVPLILGQVVGAAAVRVSTTDLVYRVSQLPLAGLLVRDGHGPIMAHAPDLSAGGFELGSYTPRTPWCEVQEPHDTPLQVLQWVADQYGLPVATGVSLPGYTVGLRYPDEVTGRQILDDLCRSLGAYWQINLQGELTAQLMSEPAAADLVITPDDIELDRIQLVRVLEPIRQLSLRYARNHQPMIEVAGSIADADPVLAERLRGEWLTVVDANALADCPLAPDEDQDSALQVQVDVHAEVVRRLALSGQRREVWELDVFLPPDVSLTGRAVAVEHPRLAGRVGLIISTALAPTREILTLEVLV